VSAHHKNKMTKKITVSSIAKELNISPTTVSFVLNDHQDKGISEATRKKVIATATSMGYQPRVSSSMQGWSKVVYLTHDIAYFCFNTSFFAGVFNHIQRKAMDSKIEISLMEIDYSENNEGRELKLQQIPSAGNEICISSSAVIIKQVQQLGYKGILIQGGGILPDTICVYCDDYNSGKEAALHALEMGHKTAGTIFTNFKSPRFYGFYETFTSEGGECPEEYKWIVNGNHQDMIKQITELASKGDLPSLFYCFADNLMFPVIKGLANNQLKVPEDISLIGTDNLYWGSIATPAFTTVDLNEELFAEKVIEAVKHTKNNNEPYHLAVPVKLIPRETVKDIS